MNKWIMPAGVCLLVGVSLPAAADYYFRGTANSWAATAMTAVTSTQYKTCQSFTTGDASGGPRFKIDRYGDWKEAYPAADYVVAANTSYKVCINPTSKVGTATSSQVVDTQAPVAATTPAAGS